MKTGQDLLDLAESRINADYLYGANVNLDDPNWGLPGSGQPFDCAEFCTWDAKQITGKLYGCLDAESDDPDPWTGAWYSDLKHKRVIGISVVQAIKTPGAILLRYGVPGMSRHIAFSDGKGGTIEARGTTYGVCRASAYGRGWNVGILIPDVEYKEV